MWGSARWLLDSANDLGEHMCHLCAWQYWHLPLLGAGRVLEQHVWLRWG